jgi:hypothetical protein
LNCPADRRIASAEAADLGGLLDVLGAMGTDSGVAGRDGSRRSIAPGQRPYDGHHDHVADRDADRGVDQEQGGRS